MQHAVFIDMLGIPRKLFPFYGQVVASFKAGIDTHLLQNLQNGLREAVEVNKLIRLPIADKGKIDVAQVMKNGAPTADASYHRNVVFFHIVGVYFGQRVLVFPHNDAGFVAPEHKNIVAEFAQAILFGGDIKIRIGKFSFDTAHS